MSREWLPQSVSEFLGTFFLVFFGCGSVILSQTQEGYNGMSVPIVFGAVVAVMIYAVGHISGAHFNPAVTLSFWALKRFPTRRLPSYLGAQFLGATIASLFHAIIFEGDHNYGATALNTTLWSGALTEMLLSFVLMFVIVSVATDHRAVGDMAGLAIGTAVALCAFVGGPLTGASMNPARSFGPMLVSNNWESAWVYLLVPILGALFGAFCYQLIRCERDSTEDSLKHGCC